MGFFLQSMYYKMNHKWMLQLLLYFYDTWLFISSYQIEYLELFLIFKQCNSLNKHGFGCEESDTSSFPADKIVNETCTMCNWAHWYCSSHAIQIRTDKWYNWWSHLDIKHTIFDKRQIPNAPVPIGRSKMYCLDHFYRYKCTWLNCDKRNYEFFNNIDKAFS